MHPIVTSFHSQEKNPIEFSYKLEDTLLSRPDHIKDLGIIFDPKLTFSKHVETTVPSAFKCLGFIIRT